MVSYTHCAVHARRLVDWCKTIIDMKAISLLLVRAQGNLIIDNIIMMLNNTKQSKLLSINYQEDLIMPEMCPKSASLRNFIRHSP